jgi:hypothetical protein
MIEENSIQKKKMRKWFILFIFIVFVGTTSGLLLGQSDTGGDKLAEEQKYSEQECHKKFAVELNNLVWNLLGKKDRTKQEDETMIHAAHASCFHWSKVGTAVNLQRGEWLISHVYAVLNRPEPALHHAKLCMELTTENNLVDFDLAYAYEGMARAYACSGEKAESEKYIKLAKEAGEKIKTKEDKDIFLGDFAAGPWYNMK